MNFNRLKWVYWISMLWILHACGDASSSKSSSQTFEPDGYLLDLDRDLSDLSAQDAQDSVQVQEDSQESADLSEDLEDQGHAPVCGNGVVEGDERCDDGQLNGVAGYCNQDCSGEAQRCGDGRVDDPELCDEGELNGQYDHCLDDCTGWGPSCGDGLIQSAFEQCDDGELNGQYNHCSSDCSGWGSFCGDGVLDDPEFCDDGELNGSPGHCQIDCTGLSLPWSVDHSIDDVQGYACDPHDWLQKYLRYRLRFRGNHSPDFPGFVSIGENSGQSLPAAHRAYHINCDGYWEFSSCPRENFEDAQGLYKWGDGTVWLGRYFDVLSSEYAVFEDLGLDSSETLNDLYLALMALNRLDEAADAFYQHPPTRDGYFLRDDVPQDFVTLDDGSYRFPRNDGEIQGYECVASSVSCEPPQTDDGSFTSQDQVIHLIHGLAMVIQWIPSDVEVNGLYLQDAAREMVHRLVWNLRENGWKVTAPDGTHPPDAWGGNAIGFSDHLAMSANRLCGDRFGVDDYRNTASRIEGEAAWNGLQVIWNSTHNFNRTLALALAAVTGVWNDGKMSAKAVGDGKEYYALTYALFNHATLPEPFSDWRIEAILDSAPCGGPCIGYDDCEESLGWLGEDRIYGPDSRGGSQHQSKAEFNGLDYMAIHNAYYLYEHGRVSFQSPTPTGDCSQYLSLMDIVQSPSSQSVYDPYDTCVAEDFDLRFCGRPWPKWLDEAYRGKVHIFIGNYEMRCISGQMCTLIASEGHSDEDDLILGSLGDDELFGGKGNDCLIGFAGNDKLEGGQGYDALYGNDGNDELYGESDNWVVLDGEKDELFGGAGNDMLKGGPDEDLLSGGEGNDTLIGDGGNDILDGGPGDDDLHGNEDDDTLRGGPGNDSLIGDSGNDVIWGGDGRDKLDGETGDDFCDGGRGDDFIRGGNGDDSLIAGDDGADRLCGNGGDDVLWGGWDGDECLGGGAILGGSDEVHGCDDESATEDECDNGAFDDW